MEWWPVAAWELRRMLQRADFVISVLLVPVLAAGSGLLMGWLASRSAREVVDVAVVRADGASLPDLARFRFETPPPDGRDREALAAAVRAKTWDAALILPADWHEGGKPELIVRAPSPTWKGRLADHLKAVARRERAEAEGITAARLERFDAPVALDERVADPDRRGSRGDRVVALMVMLLLTVALFTAVSYMIVGISGEKSARVTEVVVSAIRPQSWMDGKIVAYTIIALLLFALWGASAAMAALAFRLPLPTSINPATVGWSLVFAVVGAAFWAAGFAALMATLKDFQSASKLQGNFFMLPFLPLVLIGPVLDNPEAGWVIATASIPLFSPAMFPMLVSLGAVSAWQIALALALLVAATWAMRRFAGYAFRVGMLMYGKDVTLPELIRWSKSV
jgi:ABC-2 type transport system permease protein